MIVRRAGDPFLSVPSIVDELRERAAAVTDPTPRRTILSPIETGAYGESPGDYYYRASMRWFAATHGGADPSGPGVGRHDVRGFGDGFLPGRDRPAAAPALPLGLSPDAAAAAFAAAMQGRSVTVVAPDGFEYILDPASILERI